MAPLPFFTRLWFAWLCYFKVLFDGTFAAKVQRLALGTDPEEPKRLEAKPEPKPEPQPEPKPKPEKKVDQAKPNGIPGEDALQLLALLQREGRFIDFIEEDVASFSDADIGAAARVVHTGCRKALREHVTLEPVRKEEEGAKVTLETSPAEIKLTGNVQGKGPHTGTLRHRGWRATEVKLPTAVEGHDTRIVAQAEVEL